MVATLPKLSDFICQTITFYPLYLTRSLNLPLALHTNNILRTRTQDYLSTVAQLMFWGHSKTVADIAFNFFQVLFDMGPPLSREVQLVSFHTVSKGYWGECGQRGGYFEMTNLPPKVTCHCSISQKLSFILNIHEQVPEYINLVNVWRVRNFRKYRIIQVQLQTH
jgi:hypothetical protein